MGARRGSGRRTDGRHPTRIARCRVLRLLIHREGVAGAHEIERAECVDPEHGDFVRDAAQIGCHPTGDCRPDAVAHLGAVAIDGNLAIARDFDGTERSIASSAVILRRTGDAGTGENSRLTARLLLCTPRPDRMLLKFIEDFGRAD